MAKAKKSKELEVNADGTPKALSRLDSVLEKFNKASTLTGEITLLTEDTYRADVPAIPSGILSMDKIIGIGGYPHGRIIEVYGTPSGGKTTITLHAIAEAQRLGGIAAFVDAEHALDVKYAHTLGVDTKSLLISQPDHGEQALEVVEKLAGLLGHGDIIVVDSVSALVPKAELEGDMGQNHVGLQARMMSQAMRKLTGVVAKTGVVVIFINQIRCLPVDSYILCNGQMGHLSEVSIGDSILSGSGVYSKVTEIHHSGLVEGKEILAKHSPPFRLSDNHVHSVVDKLGNVVWKKGLDIEIGEWLIQPVQETQLIPDNIPYIDLSKIAECMRADLYCNSKLIDLPKVLDEDFAFFLGCCYSDGNLFQNEENCDYRIQFSEKSADRLSLLIDSATKLFGESAICTGKRVAVYGAYVFKFLECLGCKEYGEEKLIPDCILKSKRSVVRSFLRGAFFDTHGFSNQGFISTHSNLYASYQFSVLLYYFGISADVRSNYLYVTGRDAIKFNELIGFSEGKKAVKAVKFSVVAGARGKYEIVPYEMSKNIFNTVKRGKFKRLSSRPYYQPLKSCLHFGLNTSRERLIEFLLSLPGYESNQEVVDYVTLLTESKFYQIENIVDVSFEAMDIETDTGVFVSDRFLTHNSKIGVMFGSPETTSGGNALSFAASLRIDVRKGTTVKSGEDAIGCKTKIKIVKNKVAPPFREAEVEMRFGFGILRELEIFNQAVEFELIEKSGAWYNYKGTKLGQGSENALTTLRTTPEVFAQLEAEVRKIFFAPKADIETTTVDVGISPESMGLPSDLIGFDSMTKAGML
jgi:RecA/RadA recombinase